MNILQGMPHRLQKLTNFVTTVSYERKRILKLTTGRTIEISGHAVL
jgi:hypothetical protein